MAKPGRKPLKSDDKRSENLQIRLTPTESRALDRLARAEALTKGGEPPAVYSLARDLILESPRFRRALAEEP